MAGTRERAWNLVLGNAPVDDEVFVFEKPSKEELGNMCKAHRKTQARKDETKKLGTTLGGRDKKKASQRANAELRLSLGARWYGDRIDVVARQMLGEVRKELADALRGVSSPSVPWGGKHDPMRAPLHPASWVPCLYKY